MTNTSGNHPANPTPTGKSGQRNLPQVTRQIERARSASTGRRPRTILAVGVIVVFALIVLYAIYQGSQNGNATAGPSGYRHVAGTPGIGALAPGFTLASSTGGQLSLDDFRGKTVLLYFQEGLSCQPCWDQIHDFEKGQTALANAGVDTVVSITTDPANLVTQKARDEKLATPVLSDPTLQVSHAYQANQYGMMGDMRDGHSFILVGPDGVIRWRADYGGAPDYTMFLPTGKMLADLTAERQP